jgi:CheY-like chemotaxis protein
MHSGGTVRSGHEALLQLAESVPDLVISDIRMPGMDGYSSPDSCVVLRERRWCRFM